MARYAIVVAAVVAGLVAGLSGFVLIPLLRRLKFGQKINEIGPTWHQAKQDTPTMGGFMFIFGSLLGALAGAALLGGLQAEPDPMAPTLLAVGMVCAVLFGGIGFLDDFIKVVRKRNLGLNTWQKLVLQFLVAAAFLIALQLMGRLSTDVRLPLFGVVHFGLWFYPLSVLLIVGVVNAVNLTDGIDGLASMVTLVVMCGYLLLLMLWGRMYLGVYASAVAGGCIGFLVWNFYPAKVFMGDTGSMFLGGAVVAIGYCMGRPDILIILGLVYLVEAASVMIQMTYFKITKGKRLFKMTPIHHHFEMMGWSEVKIDATFSFAAVVCVVLAYIYAVVFG